MEKEKFKSIEEIEEAMANWAKQAEKKHRRELPWHLGPAEYSLLLSGEAKGERGGFIHAHLADCLHCCGELAGLTMVAEQPVVSFTLHRQTLMAAKSSDPKEEKEEKFVRYTTSEGDFKIELELDFKKELAHIQLMILNPKREEELNGKLVIVRKPGGDNVGVTRVRNGEALLFDVNLETVKDDIDNLIIVPVQNGSAE